MVRRADQSIARNLLSPGPLSRTDRSWGGPESRVDRWARHDNRLSRPGVFVMSRQQGLAALGGGVVKRLFSILSSVVVGLGLVVAQGPAASAAPYCGITWGSTPEVTGTYSGAALVGVRSGRHACYDRLVLDVRGDIRGFRVQYVDQVRTDGGGTVVPLRGGARLSVVALVPAYDADGKATYQPADPRELVNVSGYDTFRQVASAGSFEGQTTIGLGVRARLPFRVFVLDGPGTGSRLVVDVAHKW